MDDKYNKSLIYCIGISGIIILASSSYFPLSLFAANQNDPLYPTNSAPFGHPYKFWTQKWWEWNLAFKKSSHPNENYTPEKCSLGQKEDSPVWFLVQPYPDPDFKFDRTCTIPSGKAVITATQAGDCNYGVLKSKNLPLNDELLTHCAKDLNDHTVVEVTIDNKTYQYDPVRDRVTSDPFNVTIIPDNIMQYTNTGTYRALVDGYYIFLKPLTPGEHLLTYTFNTSPAPTFIDPNITPPPSSQKGTWHLIVK